MKYTYKIFPFLDEYIAVGVSDESTAAPSMQKESPAAEPDDVDATQDADAEEEFNEADYNIIHLNEIGKDIFELFIADKSEEEIVAALLEEYEATEAQMTELVRNFIADLADKIH